MLCEEVFVLLTVSRIVGRNEFIHHVSESLMDICHIVTVVDFLSLPSGCKESDGRLSPQKCLLAGFDHNKVDVEARIPDFYFVNNYRVYRIQFLIYIYNRNGLNLVKRRY